LKAQCESIDAEFDRHLGASGSVLSEPARRHLAECERCRNLYSYLSGPFPSVPVSPELGSRIENTLKSSLKPVRRVGSTRIIAAQLFLAFVLLAVSVASVMNAAGLRAMTVGQLMSIIAVLIGGAVLLSFSLAWQTTPGSLRRIPAGTAMTILAVALFVAVAVLFPWHTRDGFLRLGWHCLKGGLVMAVPAAVLFGMMAWRGAPLGLGMLGGTLGAIAGLVSVTVLQSNCGIQDAIHLLVWHGGVLAVSALTGFLIGSSVSRLHWKRLQ